MGVGTGSGNSISFSTIRDFYGDTNPVSLSEYNRSSNNSGLVDSTFVGADTATTGTSSQTVDDFAVTVTELNGDLVNLTTSGSNQANAPFPINATSGSLTLLNTTSFVNVVVSGNGSATFFINGSEIGSVSVDFTQGGAGFTIGGPQFTTGDQTLSALNNNATNSFSAGDVFSFSCSGCDTGTSTHGVRAVEFDITFQNNNSTGDTYTLTSSSTGASSKAVYAAGDSFLAQDNGNSNQFLLAYDNVIGSGPGTAGDINVTETSAFTGSPGSLSQRANSQSSTTSLYTITADDALISLRGNDPSGASDQPASALFTIRRNGAVVSGPHNGTNFGNGSYALYIKGPVYNGGSGLSLPISLPSVSTQAGDVIGISSVQGNAGISSQRRSQQFTTVFTNSSGSRSYSLLGGAGKSTGGAATLSPGATRNAQTTNSSGSSWAIFFDSTSGDCNVGIPTTIGVGSPVNMNLFNTVTTPLG